MSYLRPYLLLCTAVLFTFSGMANAYSRAIMTGSHSIEICAEMGYDRITLGADGEKLPTLHDCSICCIAVAVLQDAAFQPKRVAEADLAVWRGFELALNSGDAIFSIWPRGPPLKV